MLFVHSRLMQKYIFVHLTTTVFRLCVKMKLRNCWLTMIDLRVFIRRSSCHSTVSFLQVFQFLVIYCQLFCQMIFFILQSIDFDACFIQLFSYIFLLLSQCLLILSQLPNQLCQFLNHPNRSLMNWSWLSWGQVQL